MMGMSHIETPQMDHHPFHPLSLSVRPLLHSFQKTHTVLLQMINLLLLLHNNSWKHVKNSEYSVSWTIHNISTSYSLCCHKYVYILNFSIFRPPSILHSSSSFLHSKLTKTLGIVLDYSYSMLIWLNWVSKKQSLHISVI